MAKKNASRKPTLLRRFFPLLGPGLITGAAKTSSLGEDSVRSRFISCHVLPNREKARRPSDREKPPAPG